jgi:hypothetical protein
VPLRDAAVGLGLPEPAYTNRSGERADWRWLAWNDWAGTPPRGSPN